jgi:hypothetical protein
MTNKFKLQKIILAQENDFAFSDIVTKAKYQIADCSEKELNQQIRNIISIYIKNGLLLITQNGYKNINSQ